LQARNRVERERSTGMRHSDAEQGRMNGEGSVLPAPGNGMLRTAQREWVAAVACVVRVQARRVNQKRCPIV